jgi:UDP-N-acetylmuramoylalanine--D-glutamate ligase
LLGELAGLRYVDDSISTTPQSTIAAIEAFPHQEVTVLVGGYDRGVDYQVLVDFILQQTDSQLIAMPDTGLKVAHAIQQQGRETGIFMVDNLEQAVALAQKITPQSGLILLSPGAPSYGFFNDFQQRGIAFAQAAGFKASP